MQSMTTNETSPARSGTAGEGGPGAGPVSGRELRELLADDAWLDELIDRAEEGGVRLTGEGGFLPELVKAVLERGLGTELSDHLGYEQGGPGRAGVAELPQRLDPEDGRHRGRPGGHRDPAGPGRVLASPGWSPRANAAWGASMRSSSACMRAG
jgi:hypothetical protein